MNRIPLLVPRMPLADQLLPYIRQIDQNQWYTNFGPLNQELERRIVHDSGTGLSSEHVTTVSNCTIGLELALQAWGLSAGARVLIPAITFVATATAVTRVGMVPVIADVDPESWVLTPAIAREAAQQSQFDAVMPVSTFGFAHDTTAWDELSTELNVPVIIDAAGAYGNQLSGKRIDVVYSFHATKSFGAAEGGAMLSPSPERIKTVRRLANFGIDTSTGLLAEHGTNGKMSEYHCAIGLASFDAWEDTKAERRVLMGRYMKALRQHCPQLSFQQKDPDGVYPLMSVAIPADSDIQQVRDQLSAHGIETRRWYSPSLSTHPALADMPRAGDLAAAEALGQRILGLPFFLSMSNEQISHICGTLAAVLSRH